MTLRNRPTGGKKGRGTACALMIRGTRSDVGTSGLFAGLCRAALNHGISVGPFKPQNMSNNAAVTVDGGEIGRAQAAQARAAGLDPHSDMNPVVLTPKSDTGAQVILRGRRLASTEARDHVALKSRLMEGVMDSFRRLSARQDLIVVEGAGSAAEINTRHGEIANMGFAVAVRVPVIPAGDVDRGGVLGRVVSDPDGIEGPAGGEPGLGLLDVATVLRPEKRPALTDAVHAATDERVTGYEIHPGRTEDPDTVRPFARVAGEAEGAVSVDGQVAGTYLRGMFRSDAFRAAWLRVLGAAPGRLCHSASVEATLDALGAHKERHLDVAGLLAAARAPQAVP